MGKQNIGNDLNRLLGCNPTKEDKERILTHIDAVNKMLLIHRFDKLPKAKQKIIAETLRNDLASA